MQSLISPQTHDQAIQVSTATINAIADEAIAESILANEYEFTYQGEVAQ